MTLTSPEQQEQQQRQSYGSGLAQLTLLAQLQGAVTEECLMRVSSANLSEEEASELVLATSMFKKPWFSVLFHFLLGGFGVGYFYAGNSARGAGILVTTLVLTVLTSATENPFFALLMLLWGIWLFVEYFLVFKYTKKRNSDLIYQQLLILGKY